MSRTDLFAAGIALMSTTVPISTRQKGDHIDITYTEAVLASVSRAK